MSITLKRQIEKNFVRSSRFDEKMVKKCMYESKKYGRKKYS